MPDSSNPANANSLPVLHRVLINTPCPKNWDEMDGDAARRFCGHCQKHVHNFSEMGSKDVNELLNSGDNICAKICRTADGNIVTKEDKANDHKISKRHWVERLAGMAASVAALFLLGGCSDESDQSTGEVAPAAATAIQLMGEATIEEEMGDVVMMMPEDGFVTKEETENKMIMGQVKLQPTTPKAE